MYGLHPPPVSFGVEGGDFPPVKLISAPLLAFGAAIPDAATLGIFLFNFTMPITLVAISNTLPGRPGFSFGLTTLALIIGVLPTYAGAGSFLSQSPSVFAIIISSAIVLYYALFLYSRKPNV